MRPQVGGPDQLVLGGEAQPHLHRVAALGAVLGRRARQEHAIPVRLGAEAAPPRRPRWHLGHETQVMG